MTRILINPDAVSGLASRLRAVRDDLARDDRPSAADVGSPDLADAIAEFDDSWGRRRRELAEDLDTAAGSLVTVVAELTGADSGLAGSLNGR